MLCLVNRMCWNTQGWRMPTHTSTEAGDPTRVGYGVEEWNFQLDDAVDGFVYGYLYYAPPQWRIDEAGNQFRIGFWTRHPKTGDKLLVGVYDGASVPTNKDYERLDRAFLERGIYTRRANELSSVVPMIDYERAYQEVIKAVRDRWITFKCPVARVHYLEEYLPLEQVVTSRIVSWRFKTPTFVNKLALSNLSR